MNYDYTNFNNLERRDELKIIGDIRALIRAVWGRTSKDRRTVVYVTYQISSIPKRLEAVIMRKKGNQNTLYTHDDMM